MDLMGMMGKLKDTQNRIEETRKKLDSILINQESSDGLLKVTLTANSMVKNITIADDLLQDKDQLEDYLVLVLNNAIIQAKKTNQEELDAVAKVDMPMIPGMEDLFK